MHLFDTHCHLNFDAFDDDRETIVARAREAGVAELLVPAVDAETSAQALAMAQDSSSVWAAVGIHPTSTAGFTEGDLVPIRELCQNPRVVAIGEIGLDYHWDDSPPHDQKRAFEAQLMLAAENDLPVIIHNREATADVLAILFEWTGGVQGALSGRAGVLHSFSGSVDDARRAVEHGFYIGISGPITYRNADMLRQVAAFVPLDRLLIETDSPFLAPAPLRGKRNEPANVHIVAERLAVLRGLTTEAIAEATARNARALFHRTSAGG